MKRPLLIGALLTALLVSVVAPTLAPPVGAVSPAQRGHTQTAIFDKTRFVLHMGLAYYAFHHFVYDRFRHKVVQSDGTVTYENEFAKGAPHRITTIVKAAVATLFMVHELKLAYGIANKSHSATLQALVKPVNALLGRADTEYAKLRGCQAGESSTASETPTPLPTPDTPLPTPEATAGTGSASGCQYSDGDISSMNNAVNAFTKTSSQDGVSISDQAVPIPGAS